MNDNKETLSYSIVVPVYNSEKTLDELTQRLFGVMDPITEKYEILLVDDCSQDNSWDKLKTLRNENKKIKIIRLQNNFGQDSALICGLNYAKGDYVITLDDDLQNPPEEIPKLINKLQEGYSVVYAKFRIKYHSRIENFFSNILQKLIRYILDIPSDLYISGFAIYTSDVVKNVISIKSSYIYLSAFVRQCVPVNKIANVVVNHSPRKVGKSNYTIRKYLYQTFNLLFNYSTLPLMLIGIIGAIVSVVSFCGGIYIIFRYSMNHDYGLMGWNSLMVTLAFLGGMILLSIAIMGEYLLRILTEVAHGQQYVIGEMEL